MSSTFARFRKSRAARTVPEFFQEKISKDDYEQSARYTLAKARFQRWSEVYGRIVILFLLFGGLLPFLENLIIAMLPQSLSKPNDGCALLPWCRRDVFTGQSSHRSLFHVWY